ncbi:MAG: MFS transporter [Promethearchaeota archaeon]
METRNKISFFTLIFKREFGKLWIGQLMSNFGSNFSRIALIFLIFQLTGSALGIAVLGIVQVLPIILLSPFAGVVVDRFDRQRIMIISDIMQGITMIFVPFSIVLPASIKLFSLYFVVFINNCFFQFFYPARQASIPHLVTTEELMSANSLSASGFQLSQLLGPVAAGIFIYLFNYDFAFFFDGITFLFSALMIWTIRAYFSENRLKKEVSVKMVLSDLQQGAVFIARNSILLYISFFFAIVMFAIGMVNALFIPFLQIDLGLGEGGEAVFGFIVSLAALTGLLSSVIMGKRNTRKPIYTMDIGLIMAGLIVTGVGLSTELASLLNISVPTQLNTLTGLSLPPEIIPVAFIFSFVGMMNILIGIPIQTITQRLVPDHLRGKVFAFQNILINIANITGMVIAGASSLMISIKNIILFSGILILILTIGGFFLAILANLEGKLANYLATDTSFQLPVQESYSIEESKLGTEGK